MCGSISQGIRWSRSHQPPAPPRHVSRHGPPAGCACLPSGTAGSSPCGRRPVAPRTCRAAPPRCPSSTRRGPPPPALLPGPRTPAPAPWLSRRAADSPAAAEPPRPFARADCETAISAALPAPQSCPPTGRAGPPVSGRAGGRPRPPCVVRAPGRAPGWSCCGTAWPQRPGEGRTAHSCCDHAYLSSLSPPGTPAAPHTDAALCR
mmetsp:Transcript_2473/g.6361  ORF Transcript_2473/g.6361 Transcript_2473/m.6361 type:complete len:205 (-) Transcript_2473:484-1098(-)